MCPIHLLSTFITKSHSNNLKSQMEVYSACYVFINFFEGKPQNTCEKDSHH